MPHLAKAEGASNGAGPSQTEAAGHAPAAVEGEEPPRLPGQLSSKFAIDARDPESSVPSAKERDRNPLEFGYFLQDLLERAAHAQKALDYDGVIRYYRAVAKAVPDSAKGWSKLCEAYETAKDRDRAIRACKYAIDRRGVELQDYLRYVRLILSGPAPLADSEQAELNAVFQHLQKQSPSAGLGPVVDQLRCEMGTKMKSVPILEECTKQLATGAPDDPRTVVFQWTLAMLKGRRDDAERYVGLARKSGVVADSIDRMQRLTSDMGGTPRLLVVGIAATLGCLAIGVLLVMRRKLVAPRVAR
jgi:hypothetical protein